MIGQHAFVGMVPRTVVAAVLLAACTASGGSGGAQSTTPSGVLASAPPGATSSAEPVTTSSAQPRAGDSIPIASVAADDGCLDEPGRLHASASSWYPASGGALTLNGDRSTSTSLDGFRAAASAAVKDVAPAFVARDGLEYQLAGGGCTTHRYAIFTDDDAEIVVSAWRVQSAANPFWVPNEAEFVAVNDSTLVSRGSHIAVVLVVATDGTTVRVTTYGARASALVAGWPSTTTSSPTALPPGLTAITADELIPVANSVLTYVLDQR